MSTIATIKLLPDEVLDAKTEVELDYPQYRFSVI